MSQEVIIFFYSLLFIGFIGFCTFLNIIFLKFVKTLGIKNQPVEKVRWSTNVKPAIGGISFYLILLLSITFHFFLFTDDITSFNKQFIGIIFACSLSFLMGLADDAYNTAPWFKFFIQFFCAAILIYSNLFIDISSFSFINYGLTALWVIGIMNAINMLDNMDGTAGILSIAICIVLLTISIYQDGLLSISNSILISLLAALISFLFFNWYPSKIYMGDTGSQLLGVLLAALGIKFLWNSPFSKASLPLGPFVIVALTFLFPICDIITVSIKRMLKGSPPFIGGKDHTTHHLSFLGLSNTLICLIVGGVSLISGSLAALISSEVIEWGVLSILGALALIIFVFVALTIVSYKNGYKKL